MYHHPIRSFIQPPGGMCGPAVVKVVTEYFGDAFSLEYINARIPEIPERGGRWAEHLGTFFLTHGYKSRLHIVNPRVFGEETCAENLEQTLEHRTGRVDCTITRENILAMLAYIRSGGELAHTPSPDVLASEMQNGPVIMGGSSRSFANAQRVRYTETRDVGHFAVVYGWDGSHFSVADTDDEQPQVPHYTMTPDQVAHTLQEGTVTGDNALLCVWKS